jgi:hypothetical protein
VLAVAPGHSWPVCCTVTTTVLPCSAIETELNCTLAGQALELLADALPLSELELLSDELATAAPLVAPARAACPPSTMSSPIPNTVNRIALNGGRPERMVE